MIGRTCRDGPARTLPGRNLQGDQARYWHLPSPQVRSVGPSRAALAVPCRSCVGLHHVTRYRYDRPVGARARRSSGCGRRRTAAPGCRAIRSRSRPREHFVNWQQDPHGNWLARFVFPEKTTEFSRHGRSARRHVGHQSVRLLRRAVCRELSVRLSDANCDEELAPYLAPEPAGPLLAALSRVDPARAAQHRRLPRRAQSAPAAARSAISSAWSPACRRRRRR